jgi:CubicO group peptidase (beta-lactamase class C family)
MKPKQIEEAVEKYCIQTSFSGVILLAHNGQPVIEKACGLANRADSIPNTMKTRFAMASGCKLFTALAICRLVEKGQLTFQTFLKDCLDISFPHIHPEITIHHLLTHSSGIPDYWDEENQEYEELWYERPMYRIVTPADFLPLFREKKMRFSPGEKFLYTDAGFILLGLVVEQISGMRFIEYIQENIFTLCRMEQSGYFETDRLPSKTAYGYVENKDDHSWKTNIFSIPIVGGPDGGAYTTALDMLKFWSSLFDHKLLSPKITDILLTPRIKAESEGEDIYYGYGIWIVQNNGHVEAYYVTGWDPGVNMISKYYPADGVQYTILGNTNRPIMPLCQALGSLI